MSTVNTSRTFAAFLRGINVGGNNPIKMDALRAALENAGFENVKTILASGNVVFDAASTSESTIAKKIERCVRDTFDKDIVVIVRSTGDLQTMTESNPFKKIPTDSKTKFYVTFLSNTGTQELPAPKPPDESGFFVVRTSKREVFSYTVLTPGVRSTDSMTWLDKNYGKSVTTRTWGTIEKVLKAAQKEATK